MEETEKKDMPDLKLDGNKDIVIQTKEIPLKVNGEESKVVIKKLSTGERNKIQGECTQTKIIAGQPSVTVNATDVQEKILFACIVEAPFEKTLSKIKELPIDVADYLYSEYVEFADPTDKKKESLEED